MIMVFAAVVMCVGVTLHVRNDPTNRLREEMIDQIAAAARHDEDRHLPWMWRYHRFRSVSYEAMLFKVWKPLTAEAFYGDDMRFLYPTDNEYEVA